MKTYFLLISLFAAPSGLLSQLQHTGTYCEEANKIVIEKSGIYPVSQGVFDSITVDAQNNSVLYSYPDFVQSFWYKIYILADSKVTFEITPFDRGNRYNYFLYQKRGELGLAEVSTTDIEPVRANLYYDEIKNETGLSLSSKVSTNDSCPRNIREILYHTSYHAAIIARAGDILLLNVYHVKGSDCGHHFMLRTQNYSRQFQSIYENCFTSRVSVKKAGHVLNQNGFAAKGLFVVMDSTRHIRMDVDVTCKKQYRETHTILHSKIMDSYETVLENNTAYQITFSALGYRNKTVSFFTKDNPASFVRNILLSLIKEGDDFVMDKIYFYPNTYALKPGSLSQIEQLVVYLFANPGVKIEIQGHTNGNKRIKRSYSDKETVLVSEGRFRGSSQKLSQLRAELIKKYLVEKGVAPDRLLVNGYGGNKMIYARPKDQEQANKNIRVGVLILLQEESILHGSTMSK